MADLNRIRHEHLALHTLRTLRFHGSDNDALLCFSKTAHRGPSVDPAGPGSATVLVVVNLDPLGVQRGTISFDPVGAGTRSRAALRGPSTCWAVTGSRGRVGRRSSSWTRARQPAHVFRVSQPDRDAAAEVS